MNVSISSLSKEDDFKKVIDLIDEVVTNIDDEAKLKEIGKQVHTLMQNRPLFVA